MDNEGLESWKKGYITNQFYSKVLNTFRINDDKDRNYPQYQIIKGLIYFKDWEKNLRLCVPDSLLLKLWAKIIIFSLNQPTEATPKPTIA